MQRTTIWQSLVNTVSKANSMIVVEKQLEKKFDRLVYNHYENVKEQNVPITVAFLIGSNTESTGITVVHICRLPISDTVLTSEADRLTMLTKDMETYKKSEEKDYDASIRRTKEQLSRVRQTKQRPVVEYIDVGWIEHCSRQVIRMLPGGLDIVGLILLGDKNADSQLRPTMLKALRVISRLNCQMGWLNLKERQTRLALLTVDSPSGRPSVYVVDVSGQQLSSSNARLIFSPQYYHRVDSEFRFDRGFIALPPVEVGEGDILDQLMVAVSPFCTKLVNTNDVLVNGVFRRLDESLYPKGDKKLNNCGDAEVDKLYVDLLVASPEKDSIDDWNEVEECQSTSSLHLRAKVRAFGVVNTKGTVDDAVRAVKHDLLRSLYSRTELHADSVGVVEGEQRDPVSVHQLPRRVLFQFDQENHRSILFSDYLFEGDKKEDAQESFADLLELYADTDAIQDSLEREVTPSDLADMNLSGPFPVENPNALNPTTPPPLDAQRSMESVFSYVGLHESDNTRLVIGLVCLLVAMIAVGVYYFM